MAAAAADGQLQGAAEAYARALDLRPTFVEAYVNNDSVLLQLGALDSACALEASTQTHHLFAASLSLRNQEGMKVCINSFNSQSIIIMEGITNEISYIKCITPSAPFSCDLVL